MSPIVRLAYAVALALGLAVTLATALALGREDAPSSEYTEAVIGRPRVVDPLLATSDVERDIAALVFDGLMRLGPNGTPVPDLAERWDVTADGRTYTVVLRKGLTWHDGRPVTMHDVAATIEAVRAPSFGGSPALTAQWSEVQLLVVDDLTLVLHLSEPAAGFLTRLTLGIRPAHATEAVVGTGPYRLAALGPDEARLERNTSYHGGTPSIGTIRLRFFGDEAALVGALEDGAVDGALLSPQTAAALGNDGLEGRSATVLTRNAFTILYVNNASPPLDEAPLRRALLASIDRQQLAAIIGTAGEPGATVFVPGSWAAPPAEEPAILGSAQVEALWLEAGWSLSEQRQRVRDDQTLQLRIVTNVDPLREALSAAIATHLEAQGVGITIETLSASELLATRLQPRDFDLAIFGWESATDPDPYSGWHTSQLSLTGQNIAGFSDPIADALLETARVTLDLAERRGLYEDFAARFEREAASLVLLYPTRVYLRPADLDAPDPGLLFEPASRFNAVQDWSFGER